MKPENDLIYFTSPASCWEAALPLGNGRLGAMVYSSPLSETVALNEDTLWSGTPKKTTGAVDESGYNANLLEARRLIYEGRYGEAETIVRDKMNCNWSENYIAAGNLRIEHVFSDHAEPTGFRRTLDLSRAAVFSEYTRNSKQSSTRVWISAREQVLVYEMVEPEPAEIFARFESECPGAYSFDAESNELYYDAVAPYSADHLSLRWFGPSGEQGLSFRICLKVLVENGDVACMSGSVRIRASGTIRLLVAIRTNFKDWKTAPDDSPVDCKKLVQADVRTASKGDFCEKFAAHVAAHSALYARSHLEFAAVDEDFLPTNRRLAALNGRSSYPPNLAALLYNFGRYLLISCSRPGTQAANLQGIWSRGLSPPWKSNYTTNINLPMNYWPADSAGLSECAEPLFQMLRELSESGRLIAEKLYHLPGWCLHHNSDLWRLSAPVVGSPNWKYWPVGGAWLCHHVVDHYHYSGDVEFLGRFAPVIIDCARFLLGLLVDRDGVLETCPSTSPENFWRPYPGADIYTVYHGSLCDTQLIGETFDNALFVVKELGLPAEPVFEDIRRARSRLPKPKIGTCGELLEWGADVEVEECVDHRHLSHLYAAYPGWDYTPETPELFRAAQVSLDRRGDLSTGWAMGWRAALRARFMQGERANAIIRNLLTVVHPGAGGSGGVYINMMDAHPPFQIDGNFGIVAAISEIFAQSHRRMADGSVRIDLFAALPSEWTEGRISGIRTHGGAIADLEWQGSNRRFTLTATRRLRTTVFVGEKAWELNLEVGESFSDEC